MKSHGSAGKKLLIGMRCAMLPLVFCITCFSLLYARDAHAQEVLSQRVNFTVTQLTLEKALARIEQEGNVKFVYTNNQLKDALGKQVVLAAKEEKLAAVLERLFQPLHISYEVKRDKFIVLKIQADNNKPAAENASAAVLQSAAAAGDTTILVSGYVRNANGAPVTGAAVQVQNQGKGTVTDENGRFQLKHNGSDITLVVSSIGYQSQNVLVQNAGPLEIVLQEAANAARLDEVVVIGYGTTTQRRNTGSVSTVDSKTIARQPVADPLGSLQGLVPGLMITSGNGMPGSNFTVRLRGANSINADNNVPLYVVDGVPYLNAPLNQFTAANGTQSPLASINPNDIERIDVLKDADATAIYGSRGSNGVILITTKKGSTGATKVSFDVYTGASTVTHRVPMLNTQQYLAMRRQAFKNDGVVPDQDNAPDLTLWDTTAHTDWQKVLIGNTAHVTQATASVSGGSQQTHFLLSGTYRHESTVQANSQGYSRGSLHLNIDHTSQNGKFNVSTLINYSADRDQSIPTDLTQYYYLAPNYPVYDSSGKFYWYGNEQNPMAYLKSTNESKTDNLIGNVSARYTVLPGLNLKARLGYTNTNMHQVQTYPTAAFNPASGSPNMGYYGDNRVRGYIAEPQADYTKKISQGTLQVMAGGTWQQSLTEGQYLYGTDYSSDALLDNVKAASSVTVRNYNYVEYRYQSLFGRVNYNWQEKYLVNASIRRDGSSKFGPGKRFGTFSAVGAAWIFSNESWVKNNLHFLSFGKLRGSYGTTGSQGIPDYAYLDSWSPTNFPYGGSSSLYPTRLFNPDYSWELTRKLEGGLELGFLQDRILLTADYYYNRSGNQLVGQTLSPQTGFGSIVANLPATVQNTGWEFSLNTVNVRQAKFSWNSAFNITIAKNKLVAYPGLEGSADQYKYVIGQPLNIVQGFHFTGINPATGVPQFKDVNGDGTIADPDDYVVLGKTDPVFYGGFQNSLTYKDFQLSFLFQFVKQDGPQLNYGYLSTSYGSMANKDLSALNRWQQPGDVTNIPGASRTPGSPTYDNYTSFYRLSDAQWGDASYIRLKNISLTYDLARFTKKWKVPACSVYFQAQNVFTITKYKGFDPETQGYALPPLKTFTAGIRFSL